MSNKTENHTVMLAANWNPVPQLSCSLGVAYTMAKQKMRNILMPYISYTDAAPSFSSWYGEYNPANLNNIDSYSDLKYDITDINFLATYNVNSWVDLTVDLLYSDFKDKNPYVYGDETGRYSSLKTYVTFKF